MNLSVYKIKYAVPLNYGGKIVAYRLYSVDDEFTDITVAEFTSSFGEKVGLIPYRIGSVPYRKEQELVLCDDRYLRTQHEKFGVDNKLIKIARIREGVTWYIWRRPQFVQLATKIIKDIQRKFSVESYYIGEEWASIKIKFKPISGVNPESKCEDIKCKVTGDILSKYGKQIMKLGFNIDTLYSICLYQDGIFEYMLRMDNMQY